MIEDTRSRLRAFMDEKGHSVASFEKSIGASNGSVSLFMVGKNKGLGNNLEKILLCYPDLNASWLISGKGSMKISDIDLSDLLDENNALKQRLKSLESKNEMYIKPPEEGVRIESQKGGKDWGKDWPKNQNQMYIKQDIEVKNVNIVSEPVEKYGMNEELIEKFVLAQKRLFGEILDRLDRLEENKTDSKTPRPDNG